MAMEGLKMPLPTAPKKKPYVAAPGAPGASSLDDMGPAAPKSPIFGTPYGGLPYNAPSQKPFVPPTGQGIRPSSTIGQNFGANLQSRMDGTIGSRATNGNPMAPTTPPSPFGPVPPPVNVPMASPSRPDFPQLGAPTSGQAYTAPSGTAMVNMGSTTPATGQARFGGGMQLPGPQPPDQAYRDNDAEQVRRSALGLSGPLAQDMMNATAGALAQPTQPPPGGYKPEGIAVNPAYAAQAPGQLQPITPPSPNLSSSSGPPSVPMPVPFVGTNTPQMIEDSRRLYGGRNPGDGRNPGVQPNVQYGPGGQRVPNPAFYQNVPGAPAPAPPPSNYLPRQGAAPSLGIAPPPAPLPGGAPAQSERAQQMQGMLDRNPGLQDIYDRNRSTNRPPAPAGTPTGHGQYADAMRSNGGRLSDSQAYDVYKNAPADSKPDIRHTGDQRIGQGSTPLPFEKGPAPKAQPLGGFAKDDAEFKNRMEQDNRNGSLFGGTLPVKGANGKPTFAEGPMKDMPQDPRIKQNLFGANDGTGKYTKDEYGRITRGSGFSQSDADAADKAKATFDARRGGLEARRADYESRTAKNMSDRKAGVLANAQARKEGRAEKVRIQKGRLTFDERLAMQDPQAAAYGKAAKYEADSRLGLAKSNQEVSRQMQADRLKAQADNTAAQQAGALERERIRQGENGKPPGRVRSEKDIRLLPKEQQGPALVEQFGEDRANELMNQWHGTRGHNYITAPNGPSIFTPGRNYSNNTIPQPPPVGSPNRAPMGGGMQLPNLPPPPPGSLGADARRPRRYGAYEK